MKLKVGDLVYSPKNIQWSMKPMTVLHIVNYIVELEHPDFGKGTFYKSEVKKLTKKATSLINSIKATKDKLQALEDKFKLL